MTWSTPSATIRPEAATRRNGGGEMHKARVPIAAALAVAGVLLVAGIALGWRVVVNNGPATLTGDGYVGEKVATVWAGDTAYGFRSSVAWRDGGGVEHKDGWPTCLTPGDVKGLRFTGSFVDDGSASTATVLWVDCSGR